MADPPLVALLASSSTDGAKVWEVPAGGVCCRQTASIRPGVACKCVRWNASNQILAVASPAGRVHLSTLEGQTLQAIECGSKEINCMAFSAKYLAVGSGHGVLIYNVKDNSLLHSVTKHTDAVTALAFNAEGSHLLSGSANGELFLHNTQHGVMVASLASGSHGGICSIQYSIWKPNHAGTGYQDGSFICWDIVGRRPVATFQQHTGPATAIAFSTVHGALVVSAGVDKRVAFYDVNTKSALKVVTLDQPLTALSFMEDGSTIAVGSATGAVLFLDLKKSDNDNTIVTGRLDRAHVGPVHCLQFQLPISGKTHRRSTSNRSEGRSDSGASTPDSMAAASIPRSYSSTSAATTGVEGFAASATAGVVAPVSLGRSHSGLGASQRSSSHLSSGARDGVFASSTLRQTLTNGTDQMDLDGGSSGASISALPTAAAIAISSIISPIKGQPRTEGTVTAPRSSWSVTSLGSSSQAVSSVPSAAYNGRLAAVTEASTSAHSSSSSVSRSHAFGSGPVTEKSPNTTPRASPTPLSEVHLSTAPAPPSTYSPLVASTSFLQPQVSGTQVTPRSASVGVAGSSVLSVAGEDTVSLVGTTVETASRYGPSRIEHAASYGTSPRHVPPPSTVSANTAAQGITHDILSGLVDDAMVKLYSATHRDIQGMHVDMIKQFSLMQEFIQAKVNEAVAPLTQRVAELEDQMETLTRKLQGL